MLHVAREVDEAVIAYENVTLASSGGTALAGTDNVTDSGVQNPE